MHNYISSTTYMFQAIFAGVLLALLTGWLGIKIAKRLGLMDMPGSDARKQHKFPTPLAGGIGLVIALVVLMFSTGLWMNGEIRNLLLPPAIIFAFGILDDARGLSAPIKLLGQITATILLILSGVRIQIFESSTFFIGGNEQIFVILDWALTIFWLVGVTNALNLVDSMDGLSIGLSAWAFGFFMLATFNSQQFVLSILSAMLLGLCIGLGFYNTSPARLFLGDAGALLLGYFLAVIAILYTPVAAGQTSSWFVPILLVGVPIFDTTLVTVSRLRRGLPFYIGRGDHTYHRLVSLGLEPGRAVMSMHLAALLLECIAFIAISLPVVTSNLIFCGCILLGLVGVLLLDSKKRWQ
jgi:UDP-GlcNAc:undecaprenyl-phosphate GlcNAc-1-phosphate transferase